MKRKRHISDDESDEEPHQAPEQEPEQVPEQELEQESEEDNVVTFGTATAGPPVSSSKAINRRTAKDYANAPSGRVFSCPVPGCEDTITETWTVDKFYKHLNEEIHTIYFEEVGSHVCPFGCEEGFLNDYALHKHIQKQSCESAAKLLARIKNCSQCNGTSGRVPDIIGALDHLADDHPQLMSVAGSPYVCAPCGVGFPTEALFWGYLALVSGRSDAHPAKIRSLNMVYPAPPIV
jgi:hypothetical protein